MNAQDYPVTLGYKATTAPYGTAARPYHRGIDYGCPIGTPVVVNGVTIGLSGATGFVTGAHLHVGRWVNGADTNPAGGFNFDSAIVTEIHTDPNNENGKFVRVQADGASWVYLHLSEIKVTVGQELKGGDMSKDSLTREEIAGIYQLAFDNDEYPEEQIKAYTGQPLDGYLTHLLGDPSYQAHKSKVNSPPTGNFIKVTKQLYEEG